MSSCLLIHRNEHKFYVQDHNYWTTTSLKQNYERKIELSVRQLTFHTNNITSSICKPIVVAQPNI